MTAWTCDAHRVITTGDCPKCDDEMIAPAESADYDVPEVGSLWRRNPPGREVVEVQRVWSYLDEGLTVRAHSTTGGRPLVAPVTYLHERYTRVIPPAKGEA